MARKILILAVFLTAAGPVGAQLYRADWIHYNWAEISGLGLNSGITQDDQVVGPFQINFDFPYYGESYPTVWICSNGYVSFTPTGMGLFNPIPDPNPPNNSIYGLWYDLNPSIAGSIWYYFDSMNMRFIIEWDNVPGYGYPPNNPQKFEIILYADGTIDLMYHTYQPPCANACIVGIENQDGTQGVQCTYMGSGPFEPASQTGIRIWPVLSPVEITMDTLPPWVPGIRYETTLENLTDSTVSCQYWEMVLLPNGAWFGPTFGPVRISLPGGANITRARYLNIPASAPAGLYWYEGRVGVYSNAIWDTSGFYFMKYAHGSQGYKSDDWLCSDEAYQGAISKVKHASPLQPAEFALYGAFPNPFNPTTTFRFDLPEASHVNLTVYDTQGCLVTNPVNGWREAGSHEVLIDGSNLSSGIYFYCITAGGLTASGKMLLLK